MIKSFFKRKIVKDGVLYTSANIVVQLSSLIGVLFVSRYLGPTNIGIYSFLQNYVAGFLTVFMGIDMYVNWQIVKSQDVRAGLHHYIRQKASILLPLLALGILLSYLILPSDIVRFLPLLCIPVITSIFTSSVFILQYQNKAKFVTLAMISSSILLLLFKVTAVLTEQSFIVFVAINSLDGLILIALCSYYILANKKDGKKIPKSPLRLVDLIVSAKYFIIYICFWYIVTRADQFFVPAYFDAYSLGVYTSAVKVVEMSNVLIIILQSIILPRMAYIESEKGATKRMHMTLALYAALGLAAALSIQILAPFIVSVLFGAEFIATAGILKVYAWSIPGLFVSYLFTLVAMSNNTIRSLAVHSVFTSAGTILLLMFLSQSKNILYIAWASVAVYTMSALALYIMWRKKYI